MSQLNVDIQASHRILKLLRESAHVAEEILDQVPGLFALCMQNGEIIRANPRFAQCIGCDPEQIQYHNFYEILEGMSEWNRINHQWFTAQEQEIHFSGTLQSGPFVGRGFLWFLSRYENHHGQELLLLVAEEITQVQEFEKLLMRIYHATPLGICVINKDGLIQKGFSHHLESLFGETQLEGKPLADYLLGVKAQLSSLEKQSIENLFSCIGSTTDKVDTCLGHTPSLIRYQLKDRECWYKCSFKTIEENGFCNELLVLIEDQTHWIETEKRSREAESQREALYEMAVRDALTGLFNRHHMRDGVSRMLGSYHRGIYQEIALCMIDVDHFKAINDQYGHSVGDLVLHELGTLIRQSHRENDIAIRYGGEEFMVFLVASGDGCRTFAERLRKRVQDTVVHSEHGSIQFTVSLGLADFTKDDTLESIIEKADAMLYKAKRNGRNQTFYKDEKVVV